MKKTGRDFVRFDEIRIENYGILSGSYSFTFSEDRTVIAGSNGSGKTTLFNALASLGPDPRVGPNRYSDSAHMEVEVLTSGNQDLIAKYRQLIFLNCESLHYLADEPDKSAHNLSYGESATELANAAWDRFKYMAGMTAYTKSKPFKPIEECKYWAYGEKTWYGLALILAARGNVNIDLPLVLDGPLSILDSHHREILAYYLDNIAGQQIMLENSRKVDQRYFVDYRLPDPDLHALNGP